MDSKQYNEATRERERERERQGGRRERGREGEGEARDRPWCVVHEGQLSKASFVVVVENLKAKGNIHKLFSTHKAHIPLSTHHEVTQRRHYAHLTQAMAPFFQGQETHTT